MAKRQVRVAIDQLNNYALKKQNVNIIMVDSAVYLVCPLEIKSDTAKVKNTKGHILHLPLAQIEEVWAEEKATDL